MSLSKTIITAIAGRLTREYFFSTIQNYQPNSIISQRRREHVSVRDQKTFRDGFHPAVK